MNETENGKTRPPGPDPRRSIVVGVTGASGAVYAQELVRFLLRADFDVLLVLSRAARLVVAQELPCAGGTDPWGETGRDRLFIYHEGDWNAPFASGSFRFQAMVVVPASMGTVGSLAAGVSRNIIQRGADVAMKERIPLVVVPRETPLSLIHLENLTSLARAGAVVLPPCPAFYYAPSTIEDQVRFVVSRVLDVLSIPNDLYRRWPGGSP